MKAILHLFILALLLTLMGCATDGQLELFDDDDEEVEFEDDDDFEDGRDVVLVEERTGRPRFSVFPPNPFWVRREPPRTVPPAPRQVIIDETAETSVRSSSPSRSTSRPQMMPAPTPPRRSSVQSAPESTPRSTPRPTPRSTPRPTPTPAPQSTPRMVGVPDPEPTNAAPTSTSIPYGSPVPGKPGFVTTPYSGSNLIDVRGMPPGTEAKDPYSGRTFRVP